jgi:hypothetical protein
MKKNDYTYRELTRCLQEEQVVSFPDLPPKVVFANRLIHHIRLLIWMIEEKYSLPEGSRYELIEFFWEIQRIVEPDNFEESEYWFGHELIGGSWSIWNVIDIDTPDSAYAQILKKVRRALVKILEKNPEWTSQEKILSELNHEIWEMNEFRNSGTLFMLDNQ